MKKFKDPSDWDRLLTLLNLENSNFPEDHDNPWAYRDFPINKTVGYPSMDPFTGEEVLNCIDDPRYYIIHKFISDYNRESKYKAIEKVNEGLSYIPVTEWFLVSKGKGTNIGIEQGSLLYYNNNKFGKRVPMAYIGSRKELKDKIFGIVGISKTFVKVEDPDTGKRYRVWPDELEAVSAFPIVPEGSVEGTRRNNLKSLVEGLKPEYEALLKKVKR
jgi:hypothetical protein